MKPIEVSSPADLLTALNELFPNFVFRYYENDSSEFTYHSLLTDFTIFFGSKNTNFSEKQLKGFASLIHEAVTIGGDLENAFGTCFLEHLDHIQARKPLVSFLSGGAKKRLRA